MAYEVDYSKTPERLVRELFNYDNEFDYTALQLRVERDPTPSEKPDREVDITLTNISGEFHFNAVVVSLNRIQLDLLFSECGLEIREFDVKQDGSVSPDLILAEISRKYGLYTSNLDYTVVNNGDEWALKANSDNPAFAGIMPIDMTMSLATRVESVELGGFQPWDPNDIAWIIQDRELEPAPEEAFLDKGVNFQRLTHSIDATPKRNLLELDGNGHFKFYTELMEWFTFVGLPHIPSDTTANDYETKFLPEAHQGFHRVVRTSVIDAPEGYGRVYLHYNEIDYQEPSS